ncbi:hypothetical protein E2I00_003146, partial [Balaenoptera physalus]
AGSAARIDGAASPAPLSFLSLLLISTPINQPPLSSRGRGSRSHTGLPQSTSCSRGPIPACDSSPHACFLSARRQPSQGSPAPLPGAPCIRLLRTAFLPIQAQHISAPSSTPIWALPDLRSTPSHPHHTSSAPWPVHPTRSLRPPAWQGIWETFGEAKRSQMCKSARVPSVPDTRETEFRGWSGSPKEFLEAAGVARVWGYPDEVSGSRDGQSLSRAGGCPLPWPGSCRPCRRHKETIEERDKRRQRRRRQRQGCGAAGSGSDSPTSGPHPVPMPIEIVCKIKFAEEDAKPKEKEAGDEQSLLGAARGAAAPRDLATFASTSTLHGLGRACGPGPHGLRRTLWALALLTSLAAFLYQATGLARGYLTRPHLVVMDPAAPAPVAGFPAVTLCNINRFRHSALSDADIFHLANLTGLPPKDRDGHRAAGLRYPEPDMVDILNRTGHQLADMLKSCNFSGHHCSASNFS